MRLIRAVQGCFLLKWSGARSTQSKYCTESVKDQGAKEERPPLLPHRVYSLLQGRGALPKDAFICHNLLFHFDKLWVMCEVERTRNSVAERVFLWAPGAGFCPPKV